MTNFNQSAYLDLLVDCPKSAPVSPCDYRGKFCAQNEHQIFSNDNLFYHGELLKNRYDMNCFYVEQKARLFYLKGTIIDFLCTVISDFVL